MNPDDRRNGRPLTTNQTEQYLLNMSFDEVFKLLMVGMLAYNATDNRYDRIQVDSTSGGIKVASSDSALAARLDDTSTANTIYIGKAPVGSATSASVWQIAKLDTSSGLVKTWAGSAGFTQVWDNRTSLTYN